jgi:hypothetical protein
MLPRFVAMIVVVTELRVKPQDGAANVVEFLHSMLNAPRQSATFSLQEN